MLGKASEIKTALVDSRELNDWLHEHSEVNIISIQFSMAGTTVTGVLPSALIIYKEPVETPIKPRESVQWFAEVMENKLRENDHKGGWDNENIYWLWERLRDEASELLVAVDATRDLYADPLNIVLEAADVANFAMMIADKARKEAKQ
ncbi:hypothetical protein RW092_03185 [Paenibacillus sp. 3LSP]|uniref:hypothetical protein n=1 Tax=Paenibacillus sp. 3LSP TaxID=2800795 RepID=UPI0028FD5091|nr:hypothetical protein [Paenibacillus sp. 3LSP]MDU0329206.1 hypothetical protein [Paenibacillus sp. 3LSP]